MAIRQPGRPGSILCLLLLLGGHAYAKDLARGKLIKKVQCLGDSSQSYALYLPSTYTKDKEWPVVYGFSPAARGSDPVFLLKNAAEKYGYILVGSNNSRNGPSEPIEKAIAAMWKDVNARLSVNPKRNYATGFSGGSRVSLRFALDKAESFAGVISCGAFFAGSKPLPQEMPFAVFGIIGDSDFNYSEMKRAEKVLAGRKSVYWIEVFSGPHKWPTKQLMTEAVEFMQVAAMRDGTIEEDKSFLKKLARERLASADALAKKNPELALGKYRQIATFFNGTDSAQKAGAKADKLAQSPEIKKSLALAEEFASHESNLRRGPAGPRYKEALVWMQQKISEKGKLSQRANMTLRGMCQALYQQGIMAINQKKLKPAAIYFEAASDVLKGKSPAIVASAYYAACAYSLLQQKEKAIELLKRSVKAGFKDVNQLKKDKNLDNIREEESFRKILKSLDGGEKGEPAQ